MYLKLKIIAIFFVYGGALAALPDSCQDDGPDVCGSKKCVLPLGSEDEPSGTGEVWFSQCCTVTETSSTAEPITESKKYCYNYVLNGYPSNELNGIKPICSENASGNSAWTLDGQCTSDGVSSNSIFCAVNLYTLLLVLLPLTQALCNLHIMYISKLETNRRRAYAYLFLL